MEKRPHISVVVPSYGCESCLHALYEGLVETLQTITPAFELVIVDDRSPQGDWAVISELAAKDPRVRGVRLNRNFGQHSALAAGLSFAEGDWVVVMDCDLQDPPAEIKKLYARALEGYPVVFARRLQRTDGLLKVLPGKLFAWLQTRLGNVTIDSAVGNFSIISREVVLQLRQFKERNRNYGMHVSWLGYRRADVDIQHGKRHSGQSTYTFARQLTHALNTILTHSTRPLYLSVAVGLTFSGSATAYGVYLVLRKLITDQGVEGWTSVMVSLFFLSGVLMMNMGVLGLYVGNIFLEVKGRPNFIVEETTFTRPGAALSASTAA